MPASPSLSLWDARAADPVFSVVSQLLNPLFLISWSILSVHPSAIRKLFTKYLLPPCASSTASFKAEVCCEKIRRVLGLGRQLKKLLRLLPAPAPCSSPDSLKLGDLVGSRLNRKGMIEIPQARVAVMPAGARRAAAPAAMSPMLANASSEQDSKMVPRAQHGQSFHTQSSCPAIESSQVTTHSIYIL